MRARGGPDQGPKAGGLQQPKRTPRSRGGSPKSRSWQDSLLPKAPEEGSSRVSPPLGAPGVPGLVAASLPSGLCLCGHLLLLSLCPLPLLQGHGRGTRAPAPGPPHLYSVMSTEALFPKEVTSAAPEVGMSMYLFWDAMLQPAAPRRGWPWWAGAGSLQRLLEKEWLGAGLGLNAGWEGGVVLGTQGDITDTAVLSSQRSWRWGQRAALLYRRDHRGLQRGTDPSGARLSAGPDLGGLPAREGACPASPAQRASHELSRRPLAGHRLLAPASGGGTLWSLASGR